MLDLNKNSDSVLSKLMTAQISSPHATSLIANILVMILVNCPSLEWQKHRVWVEKGLYFVLLIRWVVNISKVHAQLSDHTHLEYPVLYCVPYNDYLNSSSKNLFSRVIFNSTLCIHYSIINKNFCVATKWF